MSPDPAPVPGEDEPGFLALGSNLGDRLANLQAAVDLLDATDGIEVLRSSRVYETDPVGGPEQPDYLNAAVAIRTTLPPARLLAACRAVEDALGRERDERWGPRTIDVDILTIGNRRIDEPDLQVPHPRMSERAFVLVPLRELDPRPGLGTAAGHPAPDEVFAVRPFAPPLAVPR
jgi:2-amino-4-hydroxy-6-hydroxymethyldihydropteridine diphosphokinase